MKYKCSLDVENNWTCDRNTIVNDENDCCDPIYHNNNLVCSSAPKCKDGFSQIEGECVDDNTNIYIDCEGEWTPCLSNCEDSTYRVKRKRRGRVMYVEMNLEMLLIMEIKGHVEVEVVAQNIATYYVEQNYQIQL